MLKHEEEVDAKDTEIALLKAQPLALDANREEIIDTTSQSGVSDTTLLNMEHNFGEHARQKKCH